MTSIPSDPHIRQEEGSGGDAPVPVADASVGLETKLQNVLGPLVPHAKLTLAIRKVEQVVAQEAYSGPIPHPRHFAQFKEVEPTAPDRILTMAEKEQAYRHRGGDRALTADIVSHYIALFMGFLLGLVMVGGAIYLGSIGMVSVPVGLISAGSLSMVHSFLRWGRRQTPPSDERVPIKGQALPAKQASSQNQHPTRKGTRGRGRGR